MGEDCYEGCDMNSDIQIIQREVDETTVQDSQDLNCQGSGCRLGKNSESHYYAVNIQTTTQDICEEQPCTGDESQDLRCLQNTDSDGNPVYVRDEDTDTILECQSEVDPDFKGDLWCPKDFTYNYLDLNFKHCQPLYARCDQGFLGNLENDCNSLLTEADYWGLYNSNCFSSELSPDPNVYDHACCLSTEIAGFQIYQLEDLPSYVRVY